MVSVCLSSCLSVALFACLLAEKRALSYTRMRRKSMESCMFVGRLVHGALTVAAIFVVFFI